MSSPLITIAQARALVLESASPLDAPEEVPLERALGRVLSGDLLAAGDVPPFPCSAMDGFAVSAGPPGRRLRVVGEARAGAPAERPPRGGEAIRVSTGAAVPPGTEAVVPQEQVAWDGDGAEIETTAAVAPGQHIRGAGDDMRAGGLVLRSGTRLAGIHLGAAAAAGAGRVRVSRRPRVAVLCTGDELRAPGEPLGPGEIHNSNAPMLDGLVAGRGAEPLGARRLPDDREATREGIASALAGADVVLISGGVSVGPHDHVKPALASLGVRELFWSVALQPGKPTWFGRDGAGALVFGLPGNPVSSAVTFSLFVAPALAALLGEMPERRLVAEAELAVELPRNPRREQAVRVRLERRDGRVVAVPNGPQGSHILSSLIGADALAMIPAGDGLLPAGTVVSLEELAR